MDGRAGLRSGQRVDELMRCQREKMKTDKTCTDKQTKRVEKGEAASGCRRKTKNPGEVKPEGDGETKI